MNFRIAEILDLTAPPIFQYHGFNIRRVRSPEDLDLICRFRYQVYSDEGYLGPRAFPGNTMSDRFDQSAQHIVAYARDGSIAGSLRVVLPEPNGLPTLDVFNVKVDHLLARGVVDVGKFAIVKKYRARLLTPLLKAIIESAVANKAPFILAFCPDRLALGYSELGCASTTLPELPLVDRLVRNRIPMKPYFENDEIRPRVFSIRAILLRMGVELPPFLRSGSRPQIALDPPAAAVD